MAEETPVLRDGYVAYTGGVNAAATNPRELAENQVALSVNNTVRGGWLACRDGFAFVDLIFASGSDRAAFEGGRFQGETYYSGGPEPVIVYAIGGSLFSVDPNSRKVARHAVGGKRQPLSSKVDHVFLVERDGWLIAQDGVNRPVLLNGTTARRSKVDQSEVSIGTLMADGWGRLALANIDRSRLYFSDHELDPNSDSLKFTEQNDYYLAARYFQPPRRLGKLMALAFIPFVDAPAGFGPLIAFGERAACTYDVSYPRVDGGWVSNNIERMTLLNVGACSHRCTIATDNDLIFRDQHGRLRTLSQTVREQEGRKNAQRIRRFDREVSPWIERETPTLRAWLDAAEHDDRFLFSALPSTVLLPSGAKDVVAGGLLAYNLDTLSNLRGAEEPAWDGLWTGPRPQAITSGIFGGEPQLFVLSLDADGVRRLYRQAPGQTFDTTAGSVAKPIERQIQTRWFDFKAPFVAKRLTSALMRIGDIRGPLKIVGMVRTLEDTVWVPWFEHHGGTCQSLTFAGLGCAPIETGAGEEPYLALPAVPDAYSRFYRLQVLLIVTGWCELREFVLEASPIGQDGVQSNVVCTPPATLPSPLPDCFNELSYSLP